MIRNKELLRRVIDISYEMKLSHIGSSLAVLPTLYDIYEQKNGNDIVILDNAHAHLAHLVIMDAFSDCGCEDAVKFIDQFGIHCDRRAGCDFSGGSLGHGAGAAIGFALADRKRKVYCTISDGGCAEGSVWEALRLKTELKLDNLEYHIIYNGFAAYQSVNREYLLTRLNAFTEVFFHDVGMYKYPDYLQGLQGHYHVLNEEEYTELRKLI